MKTALARTSWLIVALAAHGCGDDAADAPPGTSAPTYWADVAPILDAKCAKCHQAGGIGPFRLDTYQDAKQRGVRAAEVTKAGIMPPYLLTHDGSCGQFVDDETLTEAEKATIWRWAHEGQKEGTPVARPAPTTVGLGAAKEWKTPTIVPVAQGGQLAEVDEYRCFPLESNLERDAFITGYEVVPGTPALVHHVIALLVDPTRKTDSGKTNAEVMDALDQKDPDRAGWPCFSGAGDGVEPDAVPAVWAPGQGAVSYPAGVGVAQRPGQKVVVQIHYNLASHGGHGVSTASSSGMSDSTTVRFRHADSVERRALFVIEDGLLDTLRGGQPAVLAPGQANVTFTWSVTGQQLGLGAGLPYADVIGVMPHMHERGVRKQMKIGPDGGEMACAAKLDRWDFNWQKLYFYRGDPIRITSTSRLELTCEYDTSRDTAPVSPGWGTRNEMCSALLMVTLPPGM